MRQRRLGDSVYLECKVVERNDFDSEGLIRFATIVSSMSRSAEERLVNDCSVINSDFFRTLTFWIAAQKRLC